MQQGVLKQWKKDFGFIQIDNGERIFVHISTLKRGGIHQPRIGDTIYFTLGKDKQGRARAQTAGRNPEQLEKANARRAAHRQANAQPRYDWIDYVALSLLPLAVLLAAASPMRWPIFVGMAVLSVASYVLYAFDKTQAQKNAWRVPEVALHALAVLGGWPGALLAQRRLRHKTQKSTFRFVFIACAVLNVASLLWLIK
ncbi:DUF1294 domain-containing protein [Deefgea rivuli]|uniref:DUF1294 domain-containing protein n=1 Tax=Deefgea rivuli TaxID=400948 RepID=UPI000687A5CE|nr:DUF1294 domain-containing protein [Deefgea rivuli]